MTTMATGELRVDPGDGAPSQLRARIDAITTPALLDVVRLDHRTLRRAGRARRTGSRWPRLVSARGRGRSALPARGPDESSRLAVRAARSRGIDASGRAVPAAVFLRALGEFDAVVAPSTTTRG
ncbi:hypothetical protein [Streptomyces sp. KL116D]|uniref:hypothetical protein n=1 Tax=Streptomyces sp. KL116D TaxID=3045152 RepID=UPI003556EDFA